MRRPRVRPFPATIAEWLPVVLLALGPVAWLQWTLARERATLDDGWVWAGFTQADQPFYHAQGRELFERGNGLFAANPYDLRPDAPRTYTHLFAVVSGWTWRLTGAEPQHIDLALRLILAPVMLVLGIALVGRFVRWRPLAWPMAVAVVWGGGLSWAVALLAAVQVMLVAPEAPMEGWHLADLWRSQWSDALGGHGGWGTSLGRQVGSAPECLYHILALAAVLALTRAHWWRAVGAMALVCWAHPFTGLISGLTVTGVLAAEYVRPASRARGPLLAATAVLGVFLWYNGVFLARDPAHREIAATIRDFSSSLWWRWVLPAYGLWAVLPWLGLTRWPIRLPRRRSTRVLLLWTAVCLALVLNDRWLPLLGVKPVSPLHFSRGHLAVALTIWSAWGLAAFARRRRWSPRRLATVAWVLTLLSIPDTLRLLSRADILGTAMRRDEAAAIALLRRVPEPRRVAVVDLAAAGHGDRWVPVYTPHIGAGGHLFNTPLRAQRVEALRQFQEGEAGWEALRRLGINAIVVPLHEQSHWRARLAGWPLRPLAEGEGLLMWEVGTAPGLTANPGAATPEASP